MLANEIAHSDALAFMVAGKCTFVILTDKPKHPSLDHITLSITRKPESLPWDPLNVWYGNERVAKVEIIGQGFVVRYLPKNWLTDKHRIAAQSVEFVIRRLQEKTLPEKVHILHTGLCGACGRTLTDPESIRIGLGPICKAK